MIIPHAKKKTPQASGVDLNLSREPLY